MNFFCIGDEDTVRGFRLAGVPGLVANNADQAARALTSAAADSTCGIIILTHAVAASIPAQVETIRFEHDHPLILELPGPEGPLPGRKTWRQFVQEAVGLHLG